MTAIDTDRGCLARAAAATDAELKARITYVRGDVMTYPLPEQSFDLIAAVATLHHLPLRPALDRCRALLKPGGVLAIVGLYRLSTARDYMGALAATPISWAMRAARQYAEVAAPMQEPRDTLSHIRLACEAAIPGARIRQRLLFRYTVVWRKPPN